MPTVASNGYHAAEPASGGVVTARMAGQVMSLFVDHVTASITAELESRNIKSILLKGPFFARLFYARDEARYYTDTDLLVRNADVGRAEQSLRGCGFVRVDRDEDWIGPAPKYSHTFQRPTDGAIVDLHWRLSGAGASPDEVWSAAIEHAVELEVGGRPVAGLDPAASALLVALHNAHHGTGRPTTLADLDRAVDRLGYATWLEARCLSDRLRASEQFAAGLRLTAMGDALADHLALVRPASIEMWLKNNRSTYGAWVLARLSQANTLRGRLRICVQVALPPPIVMYTFFPLARRGRTGLVAAYLLRPLRLAVHAAPALADWIRARRALRGQRFAR